VTGVGNVALVNAPTKKGREGGRTKAEQQKKKGERMVGHGPDKRLAVSGKERGRLRKKGCGKRTRPRKPEKERGPQPRP